MAMLQHSRLLPRCHHSEVRSAQRIPVPSAASCSSSHHSLQQQQHHALYSLSRRSIEPVGAIRRARRRAPPPPPVVEEDEEEEDAEAQEGEGEELLEELSQACHIITQDNFFPEARQLRSVFDERFADPRSISPERFMWDYWHVPNQYTLVRTQAQVYFPPEMYDALEDALITYGESVLGCRAITPIWMSYYVDGCVQELHCDNPHGPFAFVFSLTEWDQRRFRGGETMILRPEVLDYWGSLYSGQQGLEQGDLLQLVEPHFNQLTVFNPSFPHGVRQVTGTKDPREARLVLHGWFTEPTPFFTGGLSAEAAVPVLNDVMEQVMEVLSDLPSARGILTVRLQVNGKTGGVEQLEWLVDTLVPLPAGPDLPSDQIRAGIQTVIRDMLMEAEFPTSEDGSDTCITLPVVFD